MLLAHTNQKSEKGGCVLKRLLSLLLCAVLLLYPVHAAEQPKYLALTFDDGPSGVYTERLLNGLAQRQVHATFFLCGYRIEQYPQITQRIAEDGHEIGMHGDQHRFFTEMSPSEVCDDLSAATQKLAEAAGCAPTLLRPPGGLYDSLVLQQTVCADLPVILWSVDPEDWRRSDIDGIVRHITSRVHCGDIILLHDMSNSSVDAALQVIDQLQAQGYDFVTVSELALLSGTAMESGGVYRKFSFENR